MSISFGGCDSKSQIWKADHVVYNAVVLQGVHKAKPSKVILSYF